MLTGTPNVAMFCSDLHLWRLQFWRGRVCLAGLCWLSWQTTVIGDPLYRPFGTSADKLHAGSRTQKHSKLVEWSLSPGC